MLQGAADVSVRCHAQRLLASLTVHCRLNSTHGPVIELDHLALIRLGGLGSLPAGNVAGHQEELLVSGDLDNGAVKSLSMGTVRSTWVVETVEETWDDDGPLAILENLVDIPGLADFEWAEGFYEGTDMQVDVEGDKLHLEFSGSAAADWTLTATYRGDQVQVVGTQRNDGMHWGDGHVVGGSVWLSTDSKLVPNHPSLAVNALVMNAPKSG